MPEVTEYEFGWLQDCIKGVDETLPRGPEFDHGYIAFAQRHRLALHAIPRDRISTRGLHRGIETRIAPMLASAS